MSGKSRSVPAKRIDERILLIRGRRVLLDSDLAELYGVTTGRLNEQVRRNRARFPVDFALELSWEEYESLRSQIAILERGGKGRGRHRKHPPLAFTEQGVAMLSSVLRSERAIQANVVIMRVFVRVREILAGQSDLVRRLDSLEKRFDSQFKTVFDAIRALVADDRRSRRKIGFGDS